MRTHKGTVNGVWMRRTVVAALLSVAVLATAATPIVNEDVKLNATGGQDWDRFAYAVAISGDTIVAGADGRDNSVFPATNFAETAYVFTPAVGGGFDQTKLLPAVTEDLDFFGHAVAVSGDTIVVGAAERDNPGLDSGAAYVFTRVGGVWPQTETVMLAANDGTPGSAWGGFGRAVAVDGDTIAVLAEHHDHAGLGDLVTRGAVYVFAGVAGVWSPTPIAELAAPRAASVAISGDTIIAGVVNDDGFSNNVGGAYVFTRVAGVWPQTHDVMLARTDGAAGDQAGESVAISGDTIVVSSRLSSPGGIYGAGSAYVYRRAAGIWPETQTEKLTASDGSPSDNFGTSVAISGETIVVASPGEDDALGGYGNGSAYVFTSDGTAAFTETLKLRASDSANNAQFGFVSAAVSGGRAVGGIIRYESGGNGPGLSGSAYVFTVPDTTTSAIQSGFFAPLSVTATPGSDPAAKPASIRAANPGGKLRVSATLDLGDGAADLSQGATITCGTQTNVVPAFTPNAKQTRWTYNSADNSVKATIGTPRDLATSKATLNLTVKGWNEVLPAFDGGGDLLALRFESGDLEVAANVQLVNGKYRSGKQLLSDPPVMLSSVRGKLKDGKPTKITIKAQFAGDGTVPAEAPDVTLTFGQPDNTYDVGLPTDDHDAKRFARGYKFTLPKVRGEARQGVTSLVVDYVRGRVTVKAAGEAFGDFAEGTVPFVFGLGLDGRADGVQVNAQKRGKKLAY